LGRIYDDRGHRMTPSHSFSPPSLSERRPPASPRLDRTTAIWERPMNFTGSDSKSDREGRTPARNLPGDRSTLKTFPPSFRKLFTKVAPTSIEQSASSNDSSASRCVARRRRGITARSSRLLSGSSRPNLSTRRSVIAGQNSRHAGWTRRPASTAHVVDASHRRCKRDQMILR